MKSFKKNFIINNILFKTEFINSKLTSLSFSFIDKAKNYENYILEEKQKSRKEKNKSNNIKELNKLSNALNSYLSGELITFKEIGLFLDHKTEFEKKVLNELRNVKYGELISYKELTQRIAYTNGFQAVGSVLKNNTLPIILPCHRIIKSSGEIGNYNAGKKYKRYLINLEKNTLSKVLY